TDKEKKEFRKLADEIDSVFGRGVVVFDVQCEFGVRLDGYLDVQIPSYTIKDTLMEKGVEVKTSDTRASASFCPMRGNRVQVPLCFASEENRCYNDLHCSNIHSLAVLRKWEIFCGTSGTYFHRTFVVTENIINDFL
ncbi:hypothetical protein E3P77_03325, partial [Wallemia ichthyophaga]